MIRVIFLSIGMALFLAGCQTSRLDEPTAQELALDQRKADAAREFFKAGKYSEAAAAFETLAATRSVDQPLYQMELSSAYLLAGEPEKAHQALMDAHLSIEGFFDQKSESKAASLWGRESEKVFKGDPYERASLYLLLSMSMLQRGDVDNALAALKTGLLADSDTENDAYTADYGLLQLLAAKCYDLRNEPGMRDQMLAAAFDSYLAIPETSERALHLLLRAYPQSGAMSPPSPWRELGAMATAEKVVEWLRAKKVPEEKVEPIAKWVTENKEGVNPLDFNALIVMWQGEPPSIVRRGEYGERRMIQRGMLDDGAYNTISVNGQQVAFLDGFGNLNYQAITRGGRVMDDVLSGQASFKGGMDAGGDAAMVMAMGDYNNPYVNLGMLAVGAVMKGVSSATKVEADIRYWHQLPHTFSIAPLSLDPGSHTLRLRQGLYGIAITELEEEISVEPGKVAILHLRPTAISTAEFYSRFKAGKLKELAFGVAAVDAQTVDQNGDGELAPAELDAVIEQLHTDHNTDDMEGLSRQEQDVIRRTYANRFQQEMVVE